MKYVFLAIMFIFTGCAVDGIDKPDSINYKVNLSQNIMDYLPNVSDSSLEVVESKELKKAFLKKHFSVWEKKFPIPSKKDMFWAIGAKSGFDESKKPINKAFFDGIVESMDIDSYPSLRKKAIMVKSTNIRALPTNKPRFSKIDGYPFDRWQNSLIFAYTPVLVLHSDKNKEWLLVQSSFVSGWVKADEVAFVSKKQAKEMMSADFVLPMKDKIPLHHNGLFVQNARVGMLLPTIKGSGKNDSKMQILAYKRDINGDAIKVRINFDKNLFASFPMPFSQANIAKMIEIVGAENYGWGGMYENRDCSSFIRDIFANVGVWLPRNSKAQVDYGKRAQGSEFIVLPENNDEKIATILAQAKPFRTIIWLQGHIMLYIGERDGAPIVAHQVWGIGWEKNTEILSSVSITTLTPRIDIENGIIVPRDSDSVLTLLDKIKAINVIR